MVTLTGYGSSLIVTKGYGRKYLSPFVKVRDFEKSFYKFIKEGYADFHGYLVYYGGVVTDSDQGDIWLYCNFSELNVEVGRFSIVHIDVVSRIASVDDYNTQLSVVIDDLRELLVNSDIDLYDFTYPEYPQKILDDKIVIREAGHSVYERLVELEFAMTLLQVIRFTVKLKLLSSFSESRVI